MTNKLLINKGASTVTSIDINDFDVFPVRELYKVKPRSYVQLPTGDVFYFDHIDGAYSYCLNMFGELCHLAAWQSVHPLVKKDDAPTEQSTSA